MTRVLVFGASGYVGTHLVPFLVARGATVRAAARRHAALEARGWRGVELVQADALSPDTLAKALEGPQVTVRIETDPVHAAAGGTDVLVLPGVGAFGAAAERLAPGRDAMRGAILGGLPTIGICLGMQLLFDGSDEAERGPQIGWNEVESVGGEPLFAAAPLPMVYYANSYVCRPADAGVVTAWTEHEGDRFPAAVRAGRAVGVQFHPEKSSSQGVHFLRAFLDEAHRARPDDFALRELFELLEEYGEELLRTRFGYLDGTPELREIADRVTYDAIKTMLVAAVRLRPAARRGSRCRHRPRLQPLARAHHPRRSGRAGAGGWRRPLGRRGGGAA